MIRDLSLTWIHDATPPAQLLPRSEQTDIGSSPSPEPSGIAAQVRLRRGALVVEAFVLE